MFRVAFSLSLALGLPVSEPVSIQKPKPVDPIRKLPTPLPKVLFNAQDFLFNFNIKLFNANPNPSFLLCNTIPKGDAIKAWKEKRSEIRRDFKQQVKQNKRLVRKKESLVNSKSKKFLERV